MNTHWITELAAKLTNDILTDSEGYDVLSKHIDHVTLNYHKATEEILAEAVVLEELLKEFKTRTLEKIKTCINMTAKENNTTWKGNASLSNFNKTKKVQLKISNTIDFDARLNIAKAKIDECLKNWTKESDDKLKTLVMRAFKVDKKGNVDARQIIALKELKFDDPLWIEAMDLIDKAITTVSSKEYISLEKREDPRSEWQSIILNISSIGE